MKNFIFKSYSFDKQKNQADFEYSYGRGMDFKESIIFEADSEYNQKALDRALFLAFVLVGISYYKTFPSVEVHLDTPVDKWQADFLNTVYQEGLGQYAYFNRLTRDDLAHFKASTKHLSIKSVKYNGEGVIALQSGGKDSLLTAVMLEKAQKEFVSWYVSNGESHPIILDDVGDNLVITRRKIDRPGLQKAFDHGAKNGHVPITYIIQSLAVIQAILLNKKEILVSIAHEGEEPHAFIGDLAVTHQWSKTWTAEQLFADYVAKYISPDIHVGSPLRNHSELRVAELFAKNCWADFGHEFSSCNVANYMQGDDNTHLSWCGNCPKCANSYLLFAPFLPASELKSIFGGQDLFAKDSLSLTFKGLLGIDGIPKPFECVGEIDELRAAYHMALAQGGYDKLPFEVPKSTFDYKKAYPSQGWATEMLQ
jgi:hypothetical protein